MKHDEDYNRILVIDDNRAIHEDFRKILGADGIETAVKMWETAPDLQVVICTAYADYSWNDMIERLGRSDRWVVLKKPFEPVEVLQLANALTEKVRLLHQAHVKEAELERRVQQRTSELEAFSYSVSHDLKAPLRRAAGFAKMLEEDYAEQLDDEGRRFLRVVRDSTKDMGHLIDDLLAFSRLGRKDLSLTCLDLPALVADAKRLSEHDAAGRNIRWDVGELPPAFGDNATIREVLVNLLSNAVKFTEPRAEAVITLTG